MMIDHWPTQTEAAKQLQVSPKTIERYAAQGKCEMRKRQRPGKKAVNVCNPKDVERLMPKAYTLATNEPASADEPPLSTSTALAARREDQEGAATLALIPAAAKFAGSFETIATRIATFVQNVEMTKSLNEKLVLTIKEAAASGFSMAFLRRKVEDGSLKSFRDGRTIKIARASLDEFARRGEIQ